MQHAPHQQVVSGEGADVRIIAGLGRGSEFNHLFLAVIDQFTGPDNVATLWDKADIESFSTQGDGRSGDCLEFAGVNQYDVVGHQVRVGKGELDLLARFHGEFRRVVLHLLDDGRNPDRGEILGV